MSSSNDKDHNQIDGVVVEALPNTLFRVVLDDSDSGEPTLAYLGGKMKIHRIKVLVGDRVTVQIDPYGGKGRIVKRYQPNRDQNYGAQRK